MLRELVSRLVNRGRGAKALRPLHGSYLPPARTTGAAPLVTVDGLERPPASLLIELRAEDPTTELVGLGNGVWWLGRVKPNQHRHYKASMILALGQLQSIKRETHYKAKLGLQGFGFIAEYRGELSSRILLDFQDRLWAEKHGLMEADFAARLKESDGTNHNQRRRDIMNDKLQSEGKLEYRIARGRRSLDMGRRHARRA